VEPSFLFKINYARAAIRARCALEQEHWAEAENLAPEPDVQPQAAAISHWAAALGAVHTGNLRAAKAHTEQVRRLSGELKEKATPIGRSKWLFRAWRLGHGWRLPNIEPTMHCVYCEWRRTMKMWQKSTL